MGDVYSDPSATASGTVTFSTWWLKDPANSALNREVNVLQPLRSERKEQQGVFRTLGRDRPVVVSGPLTGEEGELEIDFVNETEYDAFEALRLNQRVLLLQSPFDDNYYVRLGESRRTSFDAATATDRFRTVTIGFVEVNRP